MTKNRRKMRGIVRKVIKPVIPKDTEKAEIEVEGADDLYREIRVENALTDQNGETVRFKLGAVVDVVIEADSNATMKKP
jgi:hypothetical protein